ncbi:isocitrate/isopropylmalate dehydrogenase family protein [Actinophytocola gossypii]|uniref:Isocitrate/isopropylmalate dehydrogenase family protein n=1 Tax=Actinophytocola gossypii TaxID=2812003 RepID=A0ABT2J409_9PSEU|nr:isocitrate/isopropylmalate family dehydrogenase [Actinophytocola gossypii]MCT2582039.1 isocitrate/isopropylmalate dehydrogenase family protein [Actinophytocola gossypii]
MSYDIAVLEGDDIGLEIVPVAVEVLTAALDRAGVTDVVLHPLPIGAAALGEHGTTFPDRTRDALASMHGVILGPIGHAAYPPGAVNPHPVIRRTLDLYANHRPARSYPDLPSLHRDVDLVVLRENNEGFQPDRNMLAGSGEFQPDEDHAYSIRVITARQSGRIARAGFELARQRRGHVTAIHKRTVFRLTDGLFMREVERVAADYPDVRLDDHQVDTAALHLVTHPADFDVVLCTNMFGDILSDLTAGLVGGLGMAPGLSAGDEVAMAQATHGSAPDIAGTGRANPYAMIMSVRMLVAWLGNQHADPRLTAAADAIGAAVDSVLARPDQRTPDLGGTATTERMGAAVVRALG